MIALRNFARAFSLALIASLGPSCSNLATIERRSGPTMEAKIDGSDSDRLWVTDAENKRYTVERSDIVQIYHPGRPAIITGAILAGVGAAFLAAAPIIKEVQYKDGWRLDNLAIVTGIGYLLAGLSPLIYGVGTNSRSHQAAKLRLHASPTSSQELPRLPCPSCR